MSDAPTPSKCPVCGMSPPWPCLADAHVENELVVLRQRVAELEHKIGTLFDKIKHGDEGHQEWLGMAITYHFHGILPG